jgi:hypothetical protein
VVKIFLDNDGVLADFDGHCIALFGKSPRELGDVELWRLVNQDASAFWSGIPVMPRAQELIDIARPHGLTILTGCPYDVTDNTRICPIAQAHKPSWIEQHFGPGIPVITCFSRDKPLHMSAPRDILVDDFIVNIKRWQAAGGKTVWYQNADQAIARLKEKLEYELART